MKMGEVYDDAVVAVAGAGCCESLPAKSLSKMYLACLRWMDVQPLSHAEVMHAMRLLTEQTI